MIGARGVRYRYRNMWVGGWAFTFEVGHGGKHQVAVHGLTQAGLVDSQDDVGAVQGEGERGEVSGVGEAWREGEGGGWVGGRRRMEVWLRGKVSVERSVVLGRPGGVGGWVGGWVGGRGERGGLNELLETFFGGGGWGESIACCRGFEWSGWVGGWVTYLCKGHQQKTSHSWASQESARRAPVGRWARSGGWRGIVRCLGRCDREATCGRLQGWVGGWVGGLGGGWVGGG